MPWARRAAAFANTMSCATLTGAGKDRKCRARLALSAAMVLFAAFRVLTASFVFSGNATMYYRFVQGMLRSWLITGSLAAVGAVVVLPVFWRGSRWQLVMAGVFFVLAVLVLVVCMSVIHQY
jgi:hypothetical protein